MMMPAAGASCFSVAEARLADFLNKQYYHFR